MPVAFPLAELMCSGCANTATRSRTKPHDGYHVPRPGHDGTAHGRTRGYVRDL
jgi:hypothetical protein